MTFGRTTGLRIAPLALWLLFAPSSSFGQSNEFPDITGIWEGEYPVAFAESNPLHPGGLETIEMQLDVYRQEGNLFWAHNRWRAVGTAEWIGEEATGTFRLDDPTAFFVVESAPTPSDWASTGFFVGTATDDMITLTYVGVATGTSFSVELDRD